jgi:hypothetical protein
MKRSRQQRKRKFIEQVFGWGKTVSQIRQAMVRGCERVEQMFMLTQAAYNPTRMRTMAGITEPGRARSTHRKF